MDNNNNPYMHYCLKIAEEFEARINRMRAFVTNHNLTSGNANESILREFLASHAPGNVEVAQGFLCNPYEADKVSKQCDILVYNRNDFPLVYSDGPVKVVWPQSVCMVIESKTELDGRAIHNALNNIVSVKQLGWQIPGIIFGFNTCTVETAISHLKGYDKFLDRYSEPCAIIMFDKQVIIHNNYYLQHRFHNTIGTPIQSDQFTATHCLDKAFVIIYLLMEFFKATQHQIDQAQIQTIMKGLSLQHTEEENEFFYIGEAHKPASDG